MLDYLEKKFIITAIAILAVGCVTLFLAGDYLRLAGHAVSIIFVMLPGFLHENWLRFQRTFARAFIGRAQLVLATAAYFNFLGSINFYYSGSADWYDSFVHFITPAMLFILTATIPILLQKLWLKKPHLWITLFGNFILIILLSLLWEFYEYLIDSIFNSMMFGQRGEIYLDTITDLIADLIGGLFATWLLYNYFYGYILSNIRFAKK